MKCAAALAAAALLCAAPALGQSVPPTPDNRLTPGAVASTDPATVCAFVNGESYSRRHRVWDDKRSTLAKYGLPWSDHELVEDDDRVPVCLGGDNADPRNHWPQRWQEAREKDRLEALVCRLVCDDHAITLRAGQAIFLGDWREGYRRMFGTPP